MFSVLFRYSIYVCYVLWMSVTCCFDVCVMICVLRLVDMGAVIQMFVMCV